MFFNRLADSKKDLRKARYARGLLRALTIVVFAQLLVFLNASSADAQSRALRAATLENNTESLSLSPFSILQKDIEGKITQQSIEASGGTILKGRLARGKMINLGYDGVPVWISVRLRNDSDETNWVLAPMKTPEGKLGYLTSLNIYEMVFVPSSANPATPAAIKLNEIRAGSDSGGYKIRLEKYQEKLILINVAASAGKPAVFPLILNSENIFLQNEREQSIFNAAFCGILALFALIFLIWSISRQDPSQLIYTAYFMFMAFRWLTVGDLHLLMGPAIFEVFFISLILVFSVLSIFMTKIFYGVIETSYTEKYILYGLIILNCTATGIALFWPSKADAFLTYLLYIPPVITMAVISFMSFTHLKEGHVQAGLYFLSWLLPMTGLLTTLLASGGILPQTPLFLNIFWYSLVIQGVLLIPAVNQRYTHTENREQVVRLKNTSETLNLNRLKETKDTADHTRLLKVIEKERGVLAALREQEVARVDEMRRAKEMADEANRAKSAFLAVVSHEIRTPMTGVMGMVKLLLESNITKQQRDYVLTIQESSESMMALLNDILDFEKIQRGKMELENISFDLHRLIHGVVTLMSGHAAEKGIAMSARIDDDLPKFVKGDPTRLRQILLNLMGNGIKFTSTGSVTLLVKNLNHPELNDMPNKHEKYMVYFAIQDTGIGISAEAQKNLFNPFAQANSSISRKFGGSGLGLAISKGLIESMKSSININSKEGEGSTFFFTLEMEKGLPTTQEQARKPSVVETIDKPATPLRILIVDDNTIIRKVIMGLLTEDKHEIMTTTTAEDALKKINQNAFDLILMDIELPGMYGNEATKILRDHEDPIKAALPVIAMTGNVGKEDMERYLSEGMTGFLAKPIDAVKLRTIVNEIARKTFEREIKMPDDPLAPPPQNHKKDFARDIPEQTANGGGDGVFNPHMLQSLKDTIGDTQLNELLGDLIMKTEEILQAMIEASNAGDLSGLATRAHELKGMAGNFGLVEISSIAEQTEKKAKSQQVEGLGDLVGTLPEASLRAQMALKGWVAH